jgi:hypothetical protein
MEVADLGTLLNERKESMTQQFFVAPSTTTEADLNLASQEKLSDDTQGLFDSIARRAYELYESRGCAPGHEWDDWLQAESEILRPAKLQGTEEGEQLLAPVEVSGFLPHEINVRLEPRSLKISEK